MQQNLLDTLILQICPLVCDQPEPGELDYNLAHDEQTVVFNTNPNTNVYLCVLHCFCFLPLLQGEVWRMERTSRCCMTWLTSWGLQWEPHVLPWMLAMCLMTCKWDKQGKLLHQSVLVYYSCIPRWFQMYIPTRSSIRFLKAYQDSSVAGFAYCNRWKVCVELTSWIFLYFAKLNSNHNISCDHDPKEKAWKIAGLKFGQIRQHLFLPTFWLLQ